MADGHTAAEEYKKQQKDTKNRRRTQKTAEGHKKQQGDIQYQESTLQ
jgi:hypothetical protein